MKIKTPVTKQPAMSDGGGWLIIDADGYPIAYGGSAIDDIIACVNACSGLNPEAIPELVEISKCVAAMGSCHCQKNGPDVDRNYHSKLCTIGRAKRALALASVKEGR